jgi:hypothetical protein
LPREVLSPEAAPCGLVRTRAYIERLVDAFESTMHGPPRENAGHSPVPHTCGRQALAGYGAAITLLLVSCAPARWVPLSSASGHELVTDPRADVEVRAVGDVRRLWMVPSAFTAMRISIHNTGNQAVYVGLRDIQLMFEASASAALAPASIPARRRVASLGMDPASPFITQQSHGGSLGARAGRTESIVLEPALGSRFQSTFGWRDPPQSEILHSALGTGLIAAGQSREGFVYFRQVPKDVERLRLRIGVRPSADAPPTTVIELAYAVQS